MFRILSDVHLEFMKVNHQHEFIDGFNSRAVQGDSLILAGDIASPMQANFTDLLRRFKSAHQSVYYVPGNHEYYRCHNMESLEGEFEDACASAGVYPLMPGHKYVANDGTTIVGATGWYADTVGVQIGKKRFNDFHKIPMPNKIFDRHEAAKAWLAEVVDDKTIVVTHHAPTYDSVHDNWKDDYFNCFFVSDFDRIIRKNKPPVWVHGHMHESVDMMVWDTRIVSNPVGYWAERKSTEFDPEKRV